MSGSCTERRPFDTYIVTIDNGGAVTQIHNYQTNRALPKLPSGSVVLGASDEIESFSFTIYPDNPGYERLYPLTTLVDVWSSTKQETVFRGRVLTVAPAMDSDGLIYKDVVCEGEKGYLCDSIQPYTTAKHWPGDSGRTGLEEFIDYLLDNHNAQVEEEKRVYRGTVTVEPFETSDGVTKGTNYETTWACITDKLLGSFGGEIQLRRDGDGLLRLDYVPQLGQTRDTVISLGRNLQSITRTVDPSAAASRLIPLGAKLEGSEERVTIASVNGGQLYLENETARARYGLVTKVQVWEDVTEPANLLTKAAAEFETMWQAAESYSVKALNLYEIGLDPDDFDRFDSYRVVAEPIGANAILRCGKVTLNIVDPTATTIDLGDEPVTQSGLMSAIADSVAQRPTEETVNSVLTAAILAVTKAITGNSGGYVVLRPETNPEELLILDTPDVATAKNVWRWNLAGLGHSAGGVDGPYTLGLLADGSINADLIRVGTMLADRILGGTLTLGGINNANGVLSVLDADGNVSGAWDKDGLMITEPVWSLAGTSRRGIATLGKARLAFSDAYDASIGVEVSQTGFSAAHNGSQLIHLGPASGSDGSRIGEMSLNKYSGGTLTQMIYLSGVTGNATFAGTVTQGSDRRLKSNIRDIPEALVDAFLALAPRLYELTASGKTSAGLIAQEVQGTPLEPVLVLAQRDGLLTLDYTSLHALELAALQRLERRVRILEERGGERT